MIRLADYVIERLYDLSIEHIFTVTGRGILYLSDAVASHKNIKSISVHHEQAAAYGAIAYSQARDSMGACIVSTGCGSTNAITGLLSAWQDAVPCIFISGQNMMNETVRHTGIPIRTYGSQETDIISIVEPITKYSIMITDPNMIAYELDKSISMAMSGVKGPVWIDIPLDIQNARIEPEKLKRFSEKENYIYAKDEDVDYIVESINSSSRPVILIGNGVRNSGAIEEFRDFISKTKIPVTYAPSAVDVYGASNEFSIGSVGSLGGTREGNFAVQNSDLLLVIGSRLSSMITGQDFDKFARDAKTIVVDINEIEHSKKTIKMDRLILADAKDLLNKLLTKKIKQTRDIWVEKCLHWKNHLAITKEEYGFEERVDLYFLAECLSQILPIDSILLSDAGFEELIIPSTVRFTNTQRCIHSYSQGSMGFALPASIAAYIATKKPVIAVIGDGSVMMNLQELETARYYNIPLKILIINNNMYSVIRKRQEDLFRNRTIGTDKSNGVSCPDFSKIADCFDFKYYIIENNEQLNKDLDTIISTDGPIICEIMAVENQKYLHCSYTLNKNKKIVRRPIEDLSPFLDRDLFLSEMIIEAIDQ